MYNATSDQFCLVIFVYLAKPKTMHLKGKSDWVKMNINNRQGASNYHNLWGTVWIEFCIHCSYVIIWDTFIWLYAWERKWKCEFVKTGSARLNVQVHVHVQCIVNYGGRLKVTLGIIIITIQKICSFAHIHPAGCSRRESRNTGASPFSFTISVLGYFACITQHTGPTALRPIRRTKQLWF